MRDVKTLQFEAVIRAPVERVWRTMLEPDTYREWTSEFTAGSYYVGVWEEGATMRFLSPSGDGMVARIAAMRPHQQVSIEHLGWVQGGVDDLDSEAVRAWAPAYERYSFTPTPGGTRLTVEQEVAPEFEEMMTEMWPRALARLQAICERPAGGS